MLTATYNPKIIDFGMTAFSKSLSGIGTKQYAAPEVGVGKDIL